STVELELIQASEMADPGALAQLVEGAHRRELPPDRIPGNAALALWFLQHHPDLFREVFFAREIEEADSWRAAQAPPGIVLSGLTSRRAALAASLKDFFRVREGTGRFCSVDACRLPKAYGFLAHVADRLQV